MKKLLKLIRSIFNFFFNRKKYINKVTLEEIHSDKKIKTEKRVRKLPKGRLLAGRSRPKWMSFKRYKREQKEENKRIANYLKGRIFYCSSKIVKKTELDPKTGKYVIKMQKHTLAPFVRNKEHNQIRTK